MSEKDSITLKEAVPQFIEHLKALGKKRGTVYSYGKDMELAVQFFGEDKKVAAILPVHVSKYFASDVIGRKPGGDEKAPVSVEKTRRVFRQFLTWANEQGLIQNIPLPKSEKAKIAARAAKAEGMEEEPAEPEGGQ